ncbi:hypothetical protein J31TS4_15900 [Paenibacillus sp. J31TS4]|uniref:phage head closure protein n=1 Tax=Paenibacillus sp. J31TS4 TaxID=2807195 RepID=UPI001B02B074|nr:phage head closure protein [Paenibacillus sp. J31TS4]GIP38310.1 hypothetical protein J31TS4_15900 [Paenibacillus sp. J31TS4]
MTYDHELTLIHEDNTQDELGNHVPALSKTDILCGLKSVGRNEFYSAATAGLRPELIFVIHAYEYDGQRLVEFDDVRYRVVRTYGEGTEEIELTCERVAADG